MSEERRSCTARHNGENVQGYLIDWGNEQKFDESNNSYPVLVAVIEKLDGQVITVPPQHVKFDTPVT